MPERTRLALSHVFLLTLGVLSGLLALLFYLVLDGSRHAVLESAERLRGSAALRIAGRVEEYLYSAQKVIDDAVLQIHAGVLRPHDPASVEPGLLAMALANKNLAEVTLTHAVMKGFTMDGDIRLAPEERWQVSVFRRLEAGRDMLMTRVTRERRTDFECEFRDSGTRALVPGCSAGGVEDPTAHLTFQTPASRSFYGQPLWTDLHPTELDSQWPVEKRRIVVTAMKAVEDFDGTFVGVLRAGLLVEQLDAIVKTRVDEATAQDAHRVFLCDEEGTLITRIDPSDRLGDVGRNVRVIPTSLPPEIAAALKHEALKRVTPEQGWASGSLVVGNRRYLVTFRGLARTQGWRVAIVVPEDYYLGDLVRARDRLMTWAAGLMTLILLGGWLMLRIVRRGLGQIVTATTKMRRFDFAASEATSPFVEVSEVMDGLERAKTAMRAMGKYVPMGLVRRLYETKREPVLGGELQEVSMLFSDIKDFTAISERLPPDELARALGRYLEVMACAIHFTDGVIDKYIGDAVMALWNVPMPVDNHALAACRAALACQRATQLLMTREEWQGRPLLVTRIGLHRDDVLIGHFGAPDRMSYTALGDGVNLASRLEGLNKAYGTDTLASEAIRDAAHGEFAFRMLDVVAVKGKTRGIRVYELRGRCDEPGVETAATRAYEEAFREYQARRFAQAIALLEPHAGEDAPSARLIERCRKLIEDPPPPDWDGTYVSTMK